MGKADRKENDPSLGLYGDDLGTASCSSQMAQLGKLPPPPHPIHRGSAWVSSGAFGQAQLKEALVFFTP